MSVESWAAFTPLPEHTERVAKPGCGSVPGTVSWDFVETFVLISHVKSLWFSYMHSFFHWFSESHISLSTSEGKLFFWKTPPVPGSQWTRAEKQWSFHRFSCLCPSRRKRIIDDHYYWSLFCLNRYSGVVSAGHSSWVLGSVSPSLGPWRVPFLAGEISIYLNSHLVR